jgi:hypothetical protein
MTTQTPAEKLALIIEMAEYGIIKHATGDYNSDKEFLEEIKLVVFERESYKLKS